MGTLNDVKRAEIGMQAQQILKKFGDSFAEIELFEQEIHTKTSGFRKEGSGSKADDEFREMVFVNAPEKTGDFIIAEKKKW